MAEVQLAQVAERAEMLQAGSVIPQRYSEVGVFAVSPKMEVTLW